MMLAVTTTKEEKIVNSLSSAEPLPISFQKWGSRISS